MKLFITSILFILTINFSFSQEEITEPKTIEGQFDKIFRISTTYQIYKVIDIEQYKLLKGNVLDSLKKSKKSLVEVENLLDSERENIAYLNESLTKTKLELDSALLNENSISLFGIPLNKITYSLILWIIIIGLASGLGFFVFKFFNSNILTKQAQENLITVEEDFEEYRKKSLEREQKLRRQLQDEINKHRNS
jgi:hypothetical protein